MQQLPEEFIDSLRRLVGDGEAAAMLAAIADEPQSSIRVNSYKLQWSGPERVPWCDDAYYLDGRLTYTFDPLFHAGAYYVQEASSMFLDHVVRTLLDAPVLALDLCAAPGGKSTLLLSALPEGSFLVANEVVRSRVASLAANVTKWGNPSVAVTSGDPSCFARMTDAFDFILVDAPCSGEGMFRKDAGAVAEWSPSGVELCARRQRSILDEAWQALRPGGLLVYSTCTYNIKENEENVRWMTGHLGAEPVTVGTRAEWGITGALDGSSIPVYRFMPHKTRGEGLFMAVLRKPDGDVRPVALPKCKRRSVTIPHDVARLVKSDGRIEVEAPDSNRFVALPGEWKPVVEMIAGNVRVVRAGVQVASVKGRDIIPSHELVMSGLYDNDALPAVELGYDDAITYLRRGQPAWSDVARGYCVVSYSSVPLGLVKGLGNRCNNLYPQDYRILTTHTPEAIRLLVNA